jgi:L-alanine-DL-glutamate epimerase-like enolase superfamily enzyme
MTRSLTVARETFPIAGVFTIARGSRTEAHVVTATITQGANVGRGECVPYARYGETVEAVMAAIEAMAPAIAAGIDRMELARRMPPGAARNAIDCALWDLEAKGSGVAVADRLGIDPKPLTTAYTISLGTADEMAARAAAAANRPLLKVKVGTDDDIPLMRAVARAASGSALILDANEGWTPENCARNLAEAARLGFRLVEQPLPAGADSVLSTIDHPIPVCADESLHVATDLAELKGRYDAVNIKLDKTGGLTEALALRDAARAAGFGIMVGCMVGTSLAMAPAVLLAQDADWCDLDGPLLLARDRVPGLAYSGSLVHPPARDLWG